MCGIAQLNDSLETLAPEMGQTKKNEGEPRYGRSLIVLLLLLLLLAYAYWFLTKPPVAVKQKASPGISHSFSIYGWGKERFNSPNGVAVDKRGNIYVADTGNHRVAVFTSTGRYRFSFGNKRAKAKSDRLKKDALLLPLNVAVDDDYNIYVVSSMANKLSIFDSNGKFKRRVMIPDIIQLTIKGNRIFATTPGKVLIMNLKGKILKRIGSKGKEIGQFELPNGVAVDKKGNIFVSDSQNMRIQIFDKKGKLVGGRGTPPKDMNDSDRLFGLALGLTLDEKENVYIVDAFHHAVQVFSHDGDDYGEYGSKGSYDAQFNYPSDIVFLGNSTFAVADKWNDRVQVVQLRPRTGDGKSVDTGSTGGRPWWFWPLIIIILIIIILVIRWYRERRRRERDRKELPQF